MIWRALVVLLLLVPFAAAQDEKVPCRAGRDAGEIREFLKQSGQPPTKIRVMSFRYWGLDATVKGRAATGVPLIALRAGQQTPAGETDDVGLMWVVPAIAATLNIGTAPALDLFLLGAAVFGLVLGVVPFMLASPRPVARIIAGLGLSACTALALRVGDVYLIQAASMCAVVPWILYLYRTSAVRWKWLLFAVIAGSSLGFVHLIRSHGATGTLLLVICLVVASKALDLPRKALAVSLLMLAFVVPQLLFRSAVRERDAFLAAHHPEYQPRSAKHPFWHTAYLGFAFLPNQQVPAYLDEVAIAKVCSIDPAASYMGDRYEEVLRHETRGLVSRAPGLALLTILAKILIALLVLAIAANVGLIAAFRDRKDIRFHAAFWLLIAFNSTFMVLAIPDPRYVLPLAISAALYGMACLHARFASNSAF